MPWRWPWGQDMAPFRSGEGWPNNQGRVIPEAAELEAELFGPARVVPDATCRCGDYRCLGDANGSGCMYDDPAAGYTHDPRFVGSADGLDDVGGAGWRPEVGPTEPYTDYRLGWLDAHPGGCCGTGNPNCQGGCTG